MTITIHHPHDKFFKRNLKEKKIAIDFLKAYLPQTIYKSIDIHTLQLTEKSFIVPELKEIHSDIIYKCEINQTSGYLFFLVEHESTAKDELMAFRLLHYIVSLSYEHLQQGNKKLPIILPLCIYHGEVSPYPHSTDLYDNFADPEFARKVAFKPFKLIDLTVLSDDEISQHGLAALMEMLFKHQRDKNFLSIMRKMLQSHLVQNVIKQLNISYLNDMLNYVLSTTQDETEPKAAKRLIEELIKAFPEESARHTIMTFAEQLKEDYKQEFMSTLAQQLKQQGEYNRALDIAKSLLAEGMPIALVKKVTKLSDLDFIELEKA
ncbi:transposase [Candidatus Rickettsiella viridis]|uniref:Transposase n=1 Tax=Candidatus Rickettsiella viridis TaxID=676208 RepID=A0A2Z5UUP0_9COXI|nr:Rpn family recombination-promoting nuclease/putative transposase [Candidatus Rickettsiella viridis]BBB15366.1 transposase [Candidatus Rickettsiella viridis]